MDVELVATRNGPPGAGVSLTIGLDGDDGPPVVVRWFPGSTLFNVHAVGEDGSVGSVVDCFTAYEDYAYGRPGGAGWAWDLAGEYLFGLVHPTCGQCGADGCDYSEGLPGIRGDRWNDSGAGWTCTDCLTGGAGR